MKKILLILPLFITAQFSFAQWTSSSGNTTTSDNIGIGTSSPGTKLTVYQPQATGSPWFANSTFNVMSQFGNDANGNFGILAKNGGVANYSGLWLNNSFDIFSYNNNSGWFRVMHNDATKSIPSISFLPEGSGNVGIGTTNPTYSLDISNNYPTIRLNSTSSTEPGGAIRGNSSTWILGWNGQSGQEDISLGTQDNSGSRTLTFAAGGMSRMKILSNGNTGIGTTSPRSRLDINGAISITSEIGLPSAGVGVELSYQTSTGHGRLLSFDRTNNIYKVFNLNDNLYIGGVGSNIGIGTPSPDEKLTVNGTIHSTEVKVTPSVPTPDYVFEPDYKLASLEEIKAYVDKNHHLPEIPSAKEIEKKGISLGDMNMKLLKKIEELTLYLVEQQKINQSLQEQINN